MIGPDSGSSSLARSESSSAMSSTGAPSRIIGSWTYRWKSLTSASAIAASACPYTRTICRNATSGSPASTHRSSAAQQLEVVVGE